MNELVSIVMPVYNVEEFICDAVKSVLKQTYGNFELIIVNDGTKDSSIERIKYLVDKDERITIINRDNGGLSAARNTGLNYCRGKYVMFMDSDDTIDERLLERTVSLANKENSDIVVYGYTVVNVDANNSIISKEHTELNDLSFIDIINKQQIEENYIKVLAFAWNKIYKLDYLVRNSFRFEDGVSLIEDILFNAKVFKGTTKINFMSGDFYNYWIRKRKTLSSKYYSNALELAKRGLRSREELIRYLYKSAGNIDEWIERIYFTGVIGCLTNLFVYKNNLSYAEIMKTIKNIISDKEMSEKINKYNGKDVFSKLIWFFSKHNRVILIHIAYKVKYLLKGWLQ